MNFADFLKRVAAMQGYLTDEDKETPPEAMKLPVLVRCGGTRFLCTLEELPARVAALKSGDYVRDVSVPPREHGGDRWVAAGYVDPWAAAAKERDRAAVKVLLDDTVINEYRRLVAQRNRTASN